MSEQKPKIFIIGISGFLGTQLALRLRGRFLVAGAAFQNYHRLPEIQVLPIDAKRPEMLEAALRGQAPDAIINASGISDPNVLQGAPRLAEAANVMLAVATATIATKMHSQFVQLSSALVYGGAKGNFREDSSADLTAPEDLGRQKLAAETYIRAQSLQSTVLRIGKVLGLGHAYRVSAFDRIRKSLATKQSLELSKNRRESFLSAACLASAIAEVVLNPAFGKHRTYNLGGPVLTDFEFARDWAALVGADAKLVQEIPADQDPRMDYSMNGERFPATFPTWRPPSKESIYLDLLSELTPGLGVRKWQKTLRIP